MTCREEILDVLKALNKNEFSTAEVIELMEASGSRYSPWTIRTHIGSLCRVGAHLHHSTHYEDFERVGRGVYRLRFSAATTPAGFSNWYVKPADSGSPARPTESPGMMSQPATRPVRARGS
jgi:hypothetical protein